MCEASYTVKGNGRRETGENSFRISAGVIEREREGGKQRGIDGCS